MLAQSRLVRRLSRHLSRAGVVLAICAGCAGPLAAEPIYFGVTTSGYPGGYQGPQPGVWQPGFRRLVQRRNYGGPAMLVRHLHGLGYHQIVFGKRVGRHVGVSAIDPAGNRVQMAIDVVTGGIVEARVLGPAGSAMAPANNPARATPVVRWPAPGTPTMPTVRGTIVPPLPRSRPTIVAAVPRLPLSTVLPVGRKYPVSQGLSLPPPEDSDAAKLRAEKNSLVVY